jgi:hypothetical protein
LLVPIEREPHDGTVVGIGHVVEPREHTCGTVEVPQEILFNRCWDANITIPVGLGNPQQTRRNGELVRDVYPDVPLTLGPGGVGYSSPIRPTGAPNRVEPVGQPPIITRCSLAPSSVQSAETF